MSKELSRPFPSYLSPVWRSSIFDGKVVFCTGGSGTICSAQVRALVYLGANAYIVGRNANKVKKMAVDIASERRGAKVMGMGDVDVRQAGDVERAVAECVKMLGGIDYVIAGAAGNFLSPLSSLSANAFKAVIDIDLLGSFNTFKATIPHLVHSASKTATSPYSLAGPSGRILFVSATFHYTGIPLQSHVAAAKAGVDALSASIAIEYGPQNVRSNVIAPGPIEGTEGMRRLADGVMGANSQGSGIPLGSWGTVRNVADATVFLFSSTGDYVNGSVLVVDGGAWRVMGAGADYKEKLEAFTRDGIAKAKL